MTYEITEWKNISVGPLSAKASIADLQSMIDIANLKAGKPTFIGATVNGVEHVMLPKALYDEWVAADDAALDWTDANARAFPIETAPDNTLIMVWEADEQEWFIPVAKDWKTRYNMRAFTHWRPLPPPPSNPPLPAPLERLGEVLRRVKGTT